MNKDIAVIIPTYKRAEIVSSAIEFLCKNLVYDDGDIVFYIGDDSPDDYNIPIEISPSVKHKIIPGPKSGLGANLNMLLKEAINDGHELFFQMDDDHHLVEPINISEHARNLLYDPAFGWIRLMFGECRSPDGYYRFDASLYGKYWTLDPDGRELYLVSNRPHLKHIRFIDRYGFYKEGLKLGQTEDEYCKRFKQARRVTDTNKKQTQILIDVFIPMYPPSESSWVHAGDSWQGKGF